MADATLIEVNAGNVGETGFFCKMSGRKTEGYRRKLAWLESRFAEGLEITMLGGGERGFIETMPGETCWRAIDAADYLVIHCLWVVGRSKGNGFGRQLLTHAEERARARGFKGLAVVTSSGHWLIGAAVLAGAGFETVAEEAPFALHAKRLKGRPARPAFSGSFADKARRAGRGFTVFQSDQCPYLADATAAIEAYAGANGLPFRIERIESAADVRAKAPTPYGIYSVVKDGAVIAYHYLLPKEIPPLVASE